MAAQFELKVLSPSRQVVSVQAQAVTLPGTEGYMTILPGHAAMIAELDIGEVLVQTSTQTERLFVAGGYVEVDHGRVKVLADVVEKAKEIDVNRAVEARKRASGRLGTIDGTTDIDRASRSKKRADVRIMVAETMASVARETKH